MKYILARYRNKAKGFRGYLWGGIIFDGRGEEAVKGAVRFDKEEAEAKALEMNAMVVTENEI